MVAHASNHAWLNTTPEDAIEPDLPLCDPHHHLWDRREGGHGRIQSRYLLDEFLDDIANGAPPDGGANRPAGHNVRASVYIECGAMFDASADEAWAPVGETAFANGVAAMAASDLYGATRACAGIIGTVDLKLGDASAAILDAHIAAGGGRFRGIRLGAFWHKDARIANHRTQPPPHLLTREDFKAGFKHLAPRALSFEAWVAHTQIPDVIALAHAYPETSIVLDHCGGPLGIGPYVGKRDEVMAEWLTQITALAACENVTVKLGGLNMDICGFGWHERPHAPSSDELAVATAPYFEALIERFGVERCMFESNFPVDKLSSSYTVLWNSFKKITRAYSRDERAWLFHDTAARVYRLNAPTGTAPG
ncbi:MAG: amidohydrolase family protein [Pseudomonadota bacterium]